MLSEPPCPECLPVLGASSGGNASATNTFPSRSTARWCGASWALGSTSTERITTAVPSRSIAAIVSEPLFVTYATDARGIGTGSAFGT